MIIQNQSVNSLLICVLLLLTTTACDNKDDMQNARILDGGLTTIDGDYFKTQMGQWKVIHKNKNCLMKWDCNLDTHDIGLLWSECSYICTFDKDTPAGCSSFNSSTWINHDQWFFGPGCYSPYTHFDGF